MRIGELAKLTACSVQTIRYYEKEGLLDSIKRSEGNYRLYDNSAIEQLMFIKHCRGLDITLSEIRQLIDLRDSPDTACNNINALVDRHVKQVDLRIGELKELKRQLKILRRKCTTGRVVKDCGILLALSQ
ncbi:MULTISPECIES: Cd(II)/Pb(II)-responsive transcriptional regulator [Nitrosomonas]|uniref:Cd(II)/Pb(II)-responsive transcriptional regulator n=1 Tax=Nitrosomonas TaxID=914 RepID=UPI000D320775|nr:MULTISPECIES: Cd(II)/Pb(II)-responsive transcriptional regulator [Nitrosomonas]MCB1950283.1 Cd(II)/Pb(II)-responsive transcriptional regulator [Nitrosomonas sp.]PTN08609.1 Cd(II)/Pb(II)-responsive transcriptional regulator [Nitrosomonas aestuarii]